MSASSQSGTQVANVNDAHELFKIHARHDTDTQKLSKSTHTHTYTRSHTHTHTDTHAGIHTDTHIGFTAPSSAQSWRGVFIFAA